MIDVAAAVLEARAALVAERPGVRVLQRYDGALPVAFLVTLQRAAGTLVVPLAEGRNSVARGVPNFRPFGLWPEPRAIEQSQWSIVCHSRRATIADADSTNSSVLLRAPQTTLRDHVPELAALLAAPDAIRLSSANEQSSPREVPLHEGDILRSVYCAFTFAWLEA